MSRIAEISVPRFAITENLSFLREAEVSARKRCRGKKVRLDGEINNPGCTAKEEERGCREGATR